MDAPAAPEELETPQVVNLSQTTVEEVQAELVRASLTAIEHLKAEEVEMQESAAEAIHTDTLTMRRSIAGFVSTGSASIEGSLVGAVRAEQTVKFNGKAGVVVGGTIQTEDVDVVVAVGRQVSGANIRSGLLISREVHGNVETLMDTRTAVLVGVIGGLVMSVGLLIGRLLFPHRD